jgi:predicted MPP superfamily phosphohydrolase
VAQVNAARPDLVLIAGDFINGHGPSGAAARAAGLTRPLSGLRPPLGTVAVMGNHDHWTDAAAITGALRAAGVTVVENQAVQRGPVTVIGVGDGFSGHAAVGAAIASGRRLRGPKLVLTHSPDIAGSLPSGAALLLAGHTHCGQIVLPLIGPVLRHAPHLGWKRLYDPRYRCGLIRSGSVPVLVTAGIGAGTLPIRIGAAPDWWLVTLGPRRKLS